MVSHLSDILIYTLFGFSVLYPVYFWFVPRSKIDSGFYNFNLGLSGLIGGMAVVLAWATGTDQPFLFGMAGWLSIHLFCYQWWRTYAGRLVFISANVTSQCGINQAE